MGFRFLLLCKCTWTAAEHVCRFVPPQEKQEGEGGGCSVAAVSSSTVTCRHCFPSCLWHARHEAERRMRILWDYPAEDVLVRFKGTLLIIMQQWRWQWRWQWRRRRPGATCSSSKLHSGSRFPPAAPRNSSLCWGFVPGSEPAGGIPASDVVKCPFAWSGL